MHKLYVTVFVSGIVAEVSIKVFFLVSVHVKRGFQIGRVVTAMFITFVLVILGLEKENTGLRAQFV